MLSTLYHWITRQHTQPTAVGQALLWLPSIAYRLGVAAAQAWQRLTLTPVTAPVPVISIGNLTTGGTGKTPIVIALAQWLVAQGYRAVVLSRGYGASQPLSYGIPQGPQHGDEPWLIQQSVPEAVVIVGRNRAVNARRACADYQPDVILLDDGFQHQKLARQLNIVLIDASQPLKPARLLPAGPYREALSALNRADWVWLTKGTDAQRTAAKAFLETQAKQNSWSVQVSDSPIKAGQLTCVWGETTTEWPLTAIGLCGIARPESFFDDCRAQNITLVETITLPDHGIPTTTQLTYWLALSARQGQLPFITTRKDWVKLQPLIAAMAPTTTGTWWIMDQTPHWPRAWLADWCQHTLPSRPITAL